MWRIDYNAGMEKKPYGAGRGSALQGQFVRITLRGTDKIQPV